MDPADFGLTCCADDARLRLEGWRRNVGSRVALDLAPASAGGNSHGSLVVLSWNVWIGQGRLREVVTRIRNGDYSSLGADPDLPSWRWCRKPTEAIPLSRRWRKEGPAGY